MVKSRRAASSRQSSLNAMVARRPSVDTSRRNVVISTGHPSSRLEEHTSELQSLMRISYAVFCLKKKKNIAHIRRRRTERLQTSSLHKRERKTSKTAVKSQTLKHTQIHNIQ